MAHSQVWDNFLATESLLMMKNTYFTLKELFVLKIFKFLPQIFGQVDHDLESNQFAKFAQYLKK